MSFRYLKLAEAAEINPRPPGKISPQATVSFVGMADLDATHASVTSEESKKYAEVSSGYTLFNRDDILLAKITPCFENGKIGQANISEPIGVGSTEFHVIRPKSGILDHRYALHYLRIPQVRINGELRMTGSAGQRRVPTSFLASLRIPIPPISQQRRIAVVLDQVDALREQRRKAIALLDELTRSIFIEMFGDPVRNPFNWKLDVLESVALQITDGEHQTPKREASGIKLLSARNIQDGFIDFKKVDHIGLTEYERISRRCKPSQGDILISCSGTIGRVATVETNEELALVRSVALVRPNQELITSEFLRSYLQTPWLRSKMSQSAKSSSQANLFQGPIRRLPIYLPPLSVQREYGFRLAELARQRQASMAQLTELDALFASVQWRAFRGELWETSSD